MKRLMMAVALMAAGAAWACDDHVGECQIEDWRWKVSGTYLTVEGVATCDRGRVYLRMYEGEGGAFVAVADGPLKAHAFTVIASGLDSRPTDLAIKYSIEPEG